MGLATYARLNDREKAIYVDYNGDVKIRLVEQTLSDGSLVYGVLIGNVRFDCDTQTTAIDLFNMLANQYDISIG